MRLFSNVDNFLGHYHSFYFLTYKYCTRIKKVPFIDPTEIDSEFSLEISVLENTEPKKVFFMSVGI